MNSILDGSEILPQLRLVVYPIQGFIHPRWLFGISEPSTACHYIALFKKVAYHCRFSDFNRDGM